MDRFFAFRLLLENRIGIWIEGSWRLFLGEVLETVMFFVASVVLYTCVDYYYKTTFFCDWLSFFLDQ